MMFTTCTYVRLHVTGIVLNMILLVQLASASHKPLNRFQIETEVNRQQLLIWGWADGIMNCSKCGVEGRLKGIEMEGLLVQIHKLAGQEYERLWCTPCTGRIKSITSPNEFTTTALKTVVSQVEERYAETKKLRKQMDDCFKSDINSRRTKRTHESKCEFCK